MRKKTENIILLLAGLVLGGIVAILSAPTKGSNVRNGLLFGLRSYKQRLKQLITKLANSKNNVNNDAKYIGKEVITDTCHAAKKILEELDDLEKELEQYTN